MTSKVNRLLTHSHQTFILVKTSSWSLDQGEHIRTSDVCLQKTSLRRLAKTSSRRFQDNLQKRLQDIFKTSSGHIQNILPRRFAKTYSRHLQDVLQRYLQDVFKTYHQVKLFLLISLRDVFNTFLRHTGSYRPCRRSCRGLST